MPSSNSVLERFMRFSHLGRSAHISPQVRELALNYFAGESVEDAAAVGRDLSRKGLRLAYTYLASEADSPRETFDRLVQVARCVDVAEPVELSVGPSVLRVAGGPDRAGGLLAELAEAASEAGALVMLETQGHETYARLLQLFRNARDRFPNLGITIPANIRRAEKDVGDLARDAARVRVCIGAHNAPAQIAFRKRHDKSLALVRCLRILYASHATPLVASHDPRIIGIAQELAHRNHRAPEDHEFQMMFGVRPLEQRRLVDIGLVCRTWIPFGPAWYDQLTTRIATRPRMLWNYTRALLDKR